MFAEQVAQTQKPNTSSGSRATVSADRDACTREDSIVDAGEQSAPSWDFGHVPISPARHASWLRNPLWGLSAIQPKLIVGPVNDPLEQQADRTAEQVMRMPSPAPQQVTRKCSCGHVDQPDGAEPARAVQFAPVRGHVPPQLSRKCGGEQDEKLQRKEAGAVRGGATVPDRVQDVLRAPGEPLDRTIRTFFEPRFGRDLSAVRVSTDAVAAESAAMVGARAYTVGRRIAFAAGQYEPATSSGRMLLAHELAHVIRQDGVGPTAEMGVVRRAPDPDKYARLTTNQLRKLVAKGDTGALDTLYARYEAMPNEQLARHATGKIVGDGGNMTGDQIAQDVYAKRVVAPAEAAGQGSFSSEGVYESLKDSIKANRASTGIGRRGPSAVEPDIRLEGGTVGAARTDIPGLQDKTIVGQSPAAGGPGYSPESKFPPATDVKELPHTHAHAEQHIADQLEADIEASLAKVPAEQRAAFLKGRKVWMLIEQEPCSACAQGATNLETAAGVLKKLSLKYPQLTIEIKNLESSSLIVLKGPETAAVAAGGAGAGEQAVARGAGGPASVTAAGQVPQPRYPAPQAGPAATEGAEVPKTVPAPHVPAPSAGAALEGAGVEGGEVPTPGVTPKPAVSDVKLPTGEAPEAAAAAAARDMPSGIGPVTAEVGTGAEFALTGAVLGVVVEAAIVAAIAMAAQWLMGKVFEAQLDADIEAKLKPDIAADLKRLEPELARLAGTRKLMVRITYDFNYFRNPPDDPVASIMQGGPPAYDVGSVHLANVQPGNEELDRRSISIEFNRRPAFGLGIERVSVRSLYSVLLDDAPRRLRDRQTAEIIEKHRVKEAHSRPTPKKPSAAPSEPPPPAPVLLTSPAPQQAPPALNPFPGAPSGMFSTDPTDPTPLPDFDQQLAAGRDSCNKVISFGEGLESNPPKDDDVRKKQVKKFLKAESEWRDMVIFWVDHYENIGLDNKSKGCQALLDSDQYGRRLKQLRDTFGG